VKLDVSSLADHVSTGAAALAPIHELIRQRVLAAERLHCDDTPVAVPDIRVSFLSNMTPAWRRLEGREDHR
jgi:hypothetical protein